MNKARERFFLNAFIERRSDLAITDARECESPDFICMASGVRTGIEITQFFFPSESNRPPQALDSYRERLTSQLQELHKASKHLPVHASIHFWSEKHFIDPSGRKLLAERIFSFVADRIPPIGPHVEHCMDDEALDLLDMGVDRIMLIRTESLTKGTYAIGHAAFIPESRSDLIQGILDQKSHLLSEYRKKAPSIWLLILSGTGGLHSIIDFDRDVLTAKYSTGFDRVFIFRTFGPNIHELK